MANGLAIHLVTWKTTDGQIKNTTLWDDKLKTNHGCWFGSLGNSRSYPWQVSILWLKPRCWLCLHCPNSCFATWICQHTGHGHASPLGSGFLCLIQKLPLHTRFVALANRWLICLMMKKDTLQRGYWPFWLLADCRHWTFDLPQGCQLCYSASDSFSGYKVVTQSIPFWPLKLICVMLFAFWTFYMWQ